MRTSGKGPTDRTIALTGKVCGDEHGGPNNAAEVYGHFGSTRVCTRVGMTSTWVYDLKRAPKRKDA